MYACVCTRVLLRLTSASFLSFSRLKPRQAGAGGGRLAHPLAVLPTEELRWPLSGPMLGGVLDTHALRLLHQHTRDGLWKRGQSADQGRTLLEEHPDGQQSHAGALGLKSEVETSLGEGAQFKGLHIEFPLPTLPQQKVCSHCVHLNRKKGERILCNGCNLRQGLNTYEGPDWLVFMFDTFQLQITRVSHYRAFSKAYHADFRLIYYLPASHLLPYTLNGNL